MLSFIVPAYNEEHELPGALQSIRGAADAAGEPYEIVVVDDDSNDATAVMAHAAGTRVIPVHYRQIAAVRNAGARVATGDIFFFVDADTRIAPGHVTAALDALRRGYVGGSARVKLDREVPFWARSFLHVFSAVYFTLNLGVGAFIFARRADFEAAGGFDEQYFAGEEMYLTLALRKLGRFIILPEPIVTSARKVSMHSGRYFLGQWFSLFLNGKAALRARDRLGIWYDGKREGNAS